MKIKSLNIHNIASIADAFIDFEGSVLNDADIFLITGDTGSGKSTILDSVCLALYNTAPRLKATLMEGRLEQKGDYNGISLSDPRQLIRRNTGEGAVELVFEGNNGKIYTARWSSQRAYCRPGGRFQRIVHEFVCEGTTFTGDTLREERLAAVGMSYEEFVRTTMLAQGEFTRFLNCSDKEKADVLMQILDVDVYEKISRRIHKRTADENIALEQLQMRADSLELLSQEQKNALRKEKSELDERIAGLRQALESDTRRQQWFVEELELTKANLEAQKTLDEALTRSSSEDYIKDSSFLETFDNAHEVLVLMREVARTHKSLKDCKIQRRQLADDFASCSSGLREMECRIAECEKDIAGNEQWFADNQALEHTTALSELVIQNVKNYFAASARYKANTLHLDELLKGLTAKKEVLEKAKKADVEAVNRLSEQRTLTEELEKTLAEMQPDILRRNVEALAARASALELARELARDLITRESELAESVRKLDELDEAIAADSLAVREAEKTVAETKGKMDEHSQLFEKASQSMSDWSRRMRSVLGVGDVCPVCRRRIEQTFESDDEIERALLPLKEAMEESRRLHQQAADTLAERRVNISAHQKLRQAAEIARSRATEIRDAARRRIDAHCSTLSVAPGEVESALSACAAERAALLPKIEEIRGLQSRCDEQRRVVDLRIKEKEDAGRLLRAAEESVAVLESSRSSYEALRASEECRMKEFSEKLTFDVTGPWKFAWKEHPKEFIAELSAAAATRRAAEEKRDTLRREHDRLADSLTVCRAVDADIRRMMPAWGAENREMRPNVRIEAEYPALKARIEANLSAERELRERLQKLKDSVVQAFVDNQKLRLFQLCRMLRVSAEEIQSMRKNVENVKNALSEARGAFDNVLRRRETHLAARPDMSDEETSETVAGRLKVTGAEIDEALARVAVIGETFRRDAEHRERQAGIIAEMEKQKTVLARWQQLDRHFGSADGKQFSKIALRYVLGHLLEKANVYLQKIMPRYRLECRPDSFIIMVEDAYQNGARRSANVISGGESFIVSLVLALALSDVGSRLKVDILFIDEGFGTLSGDALESAVETLRTLRGNGGRRVGIISHVAELRERIPAKISVRRDGHAPSTVEVSAS